MFNNHIYSWNVRISSHNNLNFPYPKRQASIYAMLSTTKSHKACRLYIYTSWSGQAAIGMNCHAFTWVNLISHSLISRNIVPLVTKTPYQIPDKAATAGLICYVFGSMVVGAFQIAFHAEIHVNNVFLFFKNHFWHQHIKTIQKVQTALNFSTKKKFQNLTKRSYKRNAKQSLN